MFSRWLQRQWFDQRRLSPALWLLFPLSWLFGVLAGLNKKLTKAQSLPVPVVVVGNITVGGSGKTPLTLWLAKQLRAKGWQPGIVSRGHGGDNASPRPVERSSTPVEVGDEPILLFRRSGAPVWVGRSRVAAAKALLSKHPEVNVIICDDGLQHHALARDVEIAVFDSRGIGNGQYLPIGPLREQPSRLALVDAIVFNGKRDKRIQRTKTSFDMRLSPGQFYLLDDPLHTCPISSFKGKKLYAVAGIGDPSRFFKTLKKMGLSFSAHPFPDHHMFSAEDLHFAKDGVLLITEKDAVKCAGLALGETWVLPVNAELPQTFVKLIVEKLRGRKIS